MNEPRKCRLEINDRAVNALCQWAADGLTITDWRQRNPPQASQALQAELDRIVDTKIKDWKLNLTATEDTYRRRWPEISLLRAAYLAAFAAFGYRYAIRPVLSPVWEEIQAACADFFGR